MHILSLSPDPKQTLAGRTYYSGLEIGARAIAPPDRRLSPARHGHRVWASSTCFCTCTATKYRASNSSSMAMVSEVRQQVLASGKNVVLVAPWLGLGGSGNTYKTSDLTGNFGEFYIDDVLNALVPPALSRPDLYTGGRLHPALAPQAPGHSLPFRWWDRHAQSGRGARALQVEPQGVLGLRLPLRHQRQGRQLLVRLSRTKYGRPLHISSRQQHHPRVGEALSS